MTWQRPTYRMVDGERIDGAWCHVWQRRRPGAQWYVTDLIVFADGAILCGERTDVAGLEKLLEAGLLTPVQPGAAPLAVEPSKWLSRQGEPLTDEGFLAEVVDRIAQLGRRSTAGERCWEAIRCYLRQPTAHRRTLLRDAHGAVPPPPPQGRGSRPGGGTVRCATCGRPR